MSNAANAIKHVLTIAGSDSGGGAGIQADLKTCTALGCYGMSVITAVTAQNTVCVRSIHQLPPAEVRNQLEAVFEDMRVDAVKTGMLANAEIVRTVAEVLERHRPPNIVVDPVMVSKAGAHLLENEAVQALKECLLPLAAVVTPNIPEAAVLTGVAIDGYTDIQPTLNALYQLGSSYVLLKGGHLDSHDAADYLYDGNRSRVYAVERIATGNTHGTGCTYSAAIACFLANGHEIPDAVSLAKEYLTGAILAGEHLNIGSGAGPLHHGWNLRRV